MNLFSRAEPEKLGFFVFWCLALLVGTGCQNAPTPQALAKPARAERLSSSVGLTKENAFAQARAINLQTRVVRKDAQRFPMTKDLRKNRINFEIDQGLVTSAKIF